MTTATCETPVRRLERETCSRCGGSGRYSYCPRYGTMCFKCCGKKEVLTKRGAAAAAFLRDLRTRRFSDVKVGDVIRTIGVTCGGDVFSQWAKVTEINAEVQEGASMVDGVMTPYRRDGICLVTEKFATHAGPDTKIELWLPKEERQANLQKALDFQDTLTKAGTPRKRAR